MIHYGWSMKCLRIEDHIKGARAGGRVQSSTTARRLTPSHRPSPHARAPLVRSLWVDVALGVLSCTPAPPCGFPRHSLFSLCPMLLVRNPLSWSLFRATCRRYPPPHFTGGRVDYLGYRILGTPPEHEVRDTTIALSHHLRRMCVLIVEIPAAYQHRR